MTDSIGDANKSWPVFEPELKRFSSTPGIVDESLLDILMTLVAVVKVVLVVEIVAV